MKLKRLLLNSDFILTLIFLNAIVIFIQEFRGVPDYLYYIDNIFTVIFTIELLVKIQTFGFKPFWRIGWNRFDFVIILTALFSLLLSSFTPMHMDYLTFLTSLRVLRAFKSFRLIEFVPDIQSIIKGANRAMKASSVVVLAFLLLIFVVSLFTCSIYKDIAPEYFDDPLLSLYSVFRIFSIEGWYEIPDLIAERTSSTFAFITRLYFVVILFIGGVLGMSLINSVFVDAMISDNNDDLETEVKELSNKIEELTKEIRQLRDKPGLNK